MEFQGTELRVQRHIEAGAGAVSQVNQGEERGWASPG